jgi:V8-like Glu-specific endopeptidase
VQVARKNGTGDWEWRDAKATWLVSNPPAERAIHEDANGMGHLREDTALLRVEPAPTAHLPLSGAAATISDRVWMAGFPIRSARPKGSLASVGYTNADGTLRVSSGSVTQVEGGDYFTTDLDGSMGNSGSPVFDASGAVVGLFSRATGNGPRNAFEYGHTKRVHVSTRLAMQGLDLGHILESSG